MAPPLDRDVMNRHGIPGYTFSREDGVMSTQNRYSPEVRERAVRRVYQRQGERESQLAAINSMAGKNGLDEGPVFRASLAYWRSTA